MKKLLSQLVDRWEQFNASTLDLPRYLLRALGHFTRRGTRQAAALAYYAIFSLFPLILLLTVAIGRILGPAVAQEQIVNALELFLPDENTINLFVTVIDDLQGAGSFGLLAVVGLVWSALGLFSNMTSSLDIIFDVSAQRSMWRQRLIAFLMTLTFVILITASFLTSGVLRLVSAFLLNQPSIWVTIGIWFLPLGLNVVLFALLFRYIPARPVDWDAVWAASMFGAMGLELLKTAFGWYLTNLANYTVVYGGIASVIALLFWIYLIASLFLISAELCAQLNAWMISRDARQRGEHRRVEISFHSGQIHVDVPPDQ